jgi:hypothetical protein
MCASQRRSVLCLPIFCVSLMLLSCVSQAYRAHPDLELRARRLYIIGLMPTDLKMYEVSGFGLVELRDDWCAAGTENVMNAVIAALKEKGYSIKPIKGDEELEQEIEEINALYRSVHKSIQLHTYGPQLFPEKRRDFQYSLGSIEKILQKSGTDSLLFVQGVDKVLNGREEAVVSVALADASGAILWYCAKVYKGDRTLRDPKTAAGFVEGILTSFPELSG